MDGIRAPSEDLGGRVPPVERVVPEDVVSLRIPRPLLACSRRSASAPLVSSGYSGHAPGQAPLEGQDCRVLSPFHQRIKQVRSHHLADRNAAICTSATGALGTIPSPLSWIAGTLRR